MLKLKVGDKILSKMNIYVYYTRLTSKFICGENRTFEVIGIDDKYITVKYNSDEIPLHLYDVEIMFYTNNELRKLKLDKLK